MNTDPFPKTMYHKTEGSKIVRDAAKAKQLGPEWQDSPIFESAEPAPVLPVGEANEAPKPIEAAPAPECPKQEPIKPEPKKPGKGKRSKG